MNTNVRRVLHCLLFGFDVLESAAKDKQLLSTAQTLVPSGRGWKWGQTVIEFGALRCTARKPLCESCPLGDLCVARPTICTSLISLPRGGRVAGRYEDSNRYCRGWVRAVLREAPGESIRLRELGEDVREGFSEGDLP